jgi:ABC-type branched-subunit amino acid transport system ATPase component
VIDGLNASYGHVQVLFDVDLQIRAGEIMAVIGPNGAGKTTMLRVLAGLKPADSGQVRLDGNRIDGLTTEARVERSMNFVFGGQAVFADLTVDDNLIASGQLLRHDPSVLKARIAEAFELFPRLHERRRALALQLSGGEQQMLGLAKAFVLKPKLLFIDELSLGLAPTLVARLLDVLRRFRAEGTTLVLVEQSVAVALSIADRLVYFERGAPRAVITADDARAEPALLQNLFLKGDAT